MIYAPKDGSGDSAPANQHETERHCPVCGAVGVVVGLDRVLLETIPTVRPHACRVGGPGSSIAERWDAAGRDASLGVQHIWWATTCPAYRTLDGADCTCMVGAS